MNVRVNVRACPTNVWRLLASHRIGLYEEMERLMIEYSDRDNSTGTQLTWKSSFWHGHELGYYCNLCILLDELPHCECPS